ncbi:C-type lectin domain and C-type lectin-like domain and C-type lectin fold domain-containing protein [Strongyloides ratti]|uniref:C-type lectin domain and C-type lectin-like domain and C-type lectin fold domain-containing protein n=1 Tax=Strongyloides ratti TaxID=34506 RepID=A0A090MWR8_STRRB|nr:C-type lectin domain and C-type lectin-like domain and C-type lectin fold domain-containing protein [Strongyloides ratti]CEF64159.1 C-type lectin domain and C-type lectin-like domain and C-type lectin fold domain-containing protein [Strongyloides ratti]
MLLLRFFINILCILITITLQRKLNCCPKGWINNEESCYYVIRHQLDFNTAEHYCASKHSILVEVESIDEWNLIRQLPPTDRYFWIGIRDSSYDNNIITSARGSILTIQQLTYLPWLVKKKNNIQKRDNGWSSLSKCAAYFNVINVNAGYIYFYNCNLNFFAICERNVTKFGFHSI